MFHFFEAITNTKGDALPGYFGQVTDGSGNVVPIYSDDASTPIISVSGIANMAKVDSNGNLSFYVAPGLYTLTIFSTDGVTQALSPIPNMPMGTSTVTSAPGQSVSTRALLSAIVAPVANQSAVLTESGREGTFVFSTANLSAKVTADTAQGVYVAPSSDTTGASGAWVRKFSGAPSVLWFGAKGDATTDDTSAINTAVTIVGALGINALKFDPGHTFLTSTQTTFGTANVEIEGYGATLKNTLDGRAFAFSGAGVKCRGLTLYQAATGADPAPYVEVSGANVVIEGCIFTRDAAQHIPFYVRSTATGFRFRNNQCTWYGGINLISDVVDFQIVGNSFVNPGAASDDGIAIKATGTGSRRGLIAYNYFENMADFVGIGSEIGVLASTDSTYSHEVRGITIVGNMGKNCARMVMIKPGGVDGVDYRDGTVRGITISDNILIDQSGTSLLNGILIQPGRGARVIDVTGKNNKVIGRCVSGGSNLWGVGIFVRNDGTGTADCLVDKIDVGFEFIDSYNGVPNGTLVNGVAAPGAPWANAWHIEKASTSHGTVTNVICDLIANGTLNSGIVVQGGMDNGVTVRRAMLTNIDANGSSSFGGIQVASAVYVGSEISMSMASGSSGLQYVIQAGGSITPLYQQQVPAYSVVGNIGSAAATGAAVTGVPYVIAQSAVAVPLTGSTTETTLATVNIPANAIGANGRVEIEADFTYPSSANVKTLKVKLGGTTLWSGTPTTTAGLQVHVEIRNRNSASSQRWNARHILSSSAIGASTGTSAINTANAQDITITATLANSGETITLEGYDVTLAAKS